MKIWKKMLYNNIKGLGINKKNPIERKDQNTYITFLFTINIIHVHCKQFL